MGLARQLLVAWLGIGAKMRAGVLRKRKNSGDDGREWWVMLLMLLARLRFIPRQKMLDRPETRAVIGPDFRRTGPAMGSGTEAASTSTPQPRACLHCTFPNTACNESSSSRRRVSGASMHGQLNFHFLVFFPLESIVNRFKSTERLWGFGTAGLDSGAWGCSVPAGDAAVASRPLRAPARVRAALFECRGAGVPCRPKV